MRMDQQTFLRLAKRELGLSYQQLAARIGVSPRTLEKWSLARGSRDRRAMPRIAVKFIGHLLEDRRRSLILSGNRAAGESIDALVSHVDADKFRDSLRTFNALQQSASTLAPLSVVRGKPRYFVSLEEKNEWRRKEELVHARRVRKARASAR